ncbi:uncharacterized protein JCM6883_005579 [Sporobolomyces salmoneus]|uniref:uncharacterized protein n=1 Tax=Sporobolomyces salmoneus TaxID=183962 RepID=UPI0031749F8F
MSASFQTHLFALTNLVSLGLAYYEQTPNLDILFNGLHRLPHLQTLELAYLNIDQGDEFDMLDAEDEFEDRLDYLRTRPLSLLGEVTNLSQMGDFWLPWSRTISDVLPQVVKLEGKARKTDLIVKSNLSELIRVFKLAIVECYNRAVGTLYFHDRRDPLLYALSLAGKHGLDINRLEINLDDDFDRKDLKWFHVRVDGVGVFERQDHCLVLGLKLRTPSEYSCFEEEEESDEWENGF